MLNSYDFLKYMPVFRSENRGDFLEGGVFFCPFGLKTGLKQKVYGNEISFIMHEVTK